MRLGGLGRLLRGRDGAPARLRGRALQERRARWFADHPLCVEHERRGEVAVATELDHPVPLALGGADDETNLQGLCGVCHLAKSIRERGDAPRPRFGTDGWPVQAPSGGGKSV